MKLKSIFSSLLITTTIMPFVTTLASCGHNGEFSKEAETIKKVAIDEFVKLCAIPHPTFGTRQMCDYLKSQLIELGYQSVNSLQDMNNKNTFYEDEYRADRYGPEKSSGNLFFDIPPSPGREHKQGIVLQAHMDMVLDGIDEDHALTQKIEPIIDGNTIHSKDHKTSLGADDGAGVALILALAKNPNIFEHGPIRCLITSDEEDGISGASNVTEEGLKYPYLINLDSEKVNEMIVSAAGTFDLYIQAWTINTTFVRSDLMGSLMNQYELKVSGLLGGHSADAINLNRGCAIKLANSIVNQIKTITPDDGDFSLISMKSSNANNAISSETTIRFGTTLPLEAESEFDIDINWIIDVMRDTFIKEHPDETGVKIECNLLSQSEKATKGLTVAGSRNILDMIPYCVFGPIAWLDDEHKEVETSSNLADLNLDLTLEGTTENPQFKIENLVRSSKGEKKEIVKKFCEQLGEEYIRAMVLGDGSPIRIMTETPAWEACDDSVYRNLAINGFINAGKKDVSVINCHAWLEPGYFWEKYTTQQIKPHMISIGCDITDCHSKRETLYIDTYKPLIQTVLYVINKVNTIN